MIIHLKKKKPIKVDEKNYEEKKRTAKYQAVARKMVRNKEQQCICGKEEKKECCDDDGVNTLRASASLRSRCYMKHSVNALESRITIISDGILFPRNLWFPY